MSVAFRNSENEKMVLIKSVIAYRNNQPLSGDIFVNSPSPPSSSASEHSADDYRKPYFAHHLALNPSARLASNFPMNRSAANLTMGRRIQSEN
jgi:hypothetical protein